jgi:hypothetical protein
VSKGISRSLFAVLAVFAYFPFGWLLHRRLAVSWRYRRHPELFVENTAAFDNDSVFVSNRHMDLRLDWDRLHSIVLTPRGLLFLLPPQRPLFWLPQRLFDGNNFKEQILDHAVKRKIKVCRMA